MECGEQCVTMAGITMMPELCADNWDTVVEVSSFIGKKTGDVVGICYIVTWIVKLLSHENVCCSWVVFSKAWRFKTQKRTNLHHDSVS